MAKKPKSATTFSSIATCAALSFFTTLAVFLITLNVMTFLDKQKVLAIATTTAEEAPRFTEEKAYWHDVILHHPSYRDAYIELAQIEIELGNNSEAMMYLGLAKELDPNSPAVLGYLQTLE